jgi:hypothetical protein
MSFYFWKYYVREIVVDQTKIAHVISIYLELEECWINLTDFQKFEFFEFFENYSGKIRIFFARFLHDFLKFSLRILTENVTRVAIENYKESSRTTMRQLPSKIAFKNQVEIPKKVQQIISPPCRNPCPYKKNKNRSISKVFSLFIESIQ